MGFTTAVERGDRGKKAARPNLQLCHFIGAFARVLCRIMASKLLRSCPLTLHFLTWKQRSNPADVLGFCTSPFFPTPPCRRIYKGTERTSSSHFFFTVMNGKKCQSDSKSCERKEHAGVHVNLLITTTRPCLLCQNYVFVLRVFITSSKLNNFSPMPYN